jgi:hypothetical protein
MVSKTAVTAALMAAAFVFASADTTQAQVRVLDFEGLGDLEAVDEYYNGGFGGDGSGPGPSWGISFLNSLAIESIESGGSGNFTNAPSGNTILFFLSGTASTMNVNGGFMTGFSFFYSSISHAGEVRVWDGLNGTGNLLASLSLNPLGGCSYPGAYCNWEAIGVEFEGTAMSVDFGGVANFIGFDDITLGSRDPGVPDPVVPEPITMVLLGTGLAGVAAARRRQKKNSDIE